MSECNEHIESILDETFKVIDVIFSNNRAEFDLREIKIKQKNGKFRSIKGVNIYAIIKSCISTYNKNGINLYKTFKSTKASIPSTFPLLENCHIL